MKKYIIEFIGTFFLVLTIAFSANPIAIGIVLAAMVYMGGYISGGHYNPAVTLAVLIQKKITPLHSLAYMVFQVLGAVLASLVFLYIKQTPFIVQPGAAYTFFQAFLVEALFTFALCSVVLHTAVSKKNTPNSFFGLAIGGTVLAGAFAVGSISGGAFNPAVGVGPILANTNQLSQSGSLILLYIFGPCVGALIASLIYSLVKE